MDLSFLLQYFEFKITESGKIDLNLNQKNSNGHTPLMSCIFLGSKQNIDFNVIKYLFKKSDFSIQNDQKETAIDILIKYNSKFQVNFDDFLEIIKTKPDILSKKDIYGYNSIMKMLYLKDDDQLCLNSEKLMKLIELNINCLKNISLNGYNIFLICLEKGLEKYNIKDMIYIYENSDTQYIANKLDKNFQYKESFLNFLEEKKIYEEKEMLNKKINNKNVIKNKLNKI